MQCLNKGWMSSKVQRNLIINRLEHAQPLLWSSREPSAHSPIRYNSHNNWKYLNKHRKYDMETEPAVLHNIAYYLPQFYHLLCGRWTNFSLFVRTGSYLHVKTQTVCVTTAGGFNTDQSLTWHNGGSSDRQNRCLCARCNNPNVMNDSSPARPSHMCLSVISSLWPGLTQSDERGPLHPH